MTPTLIETPGGERLVLLTEAEYRRLQAKAEAVRSEDPVPSAYANRIFAGEHPVRAYRDWRHMTARALAEAANVSPGHLSDIESGRRDASFDLRSRLAAALGVEADDLVPARMD